MRYPLLLLAILFAVQQAFAQTAQEQEQVDPKGAPPVQVGDAEKNRPKKSPAPANTFTPSEKIEADSAVSFPVDI